MSARTRTHPPRSAALTSSARCLSSATHISPSVAATWSAWVVRGKGRHGAGEESNGGAIGLPGVVQVPVSVLRFAGHAVVRVGVLPRTTCKSHTNSWRTKVDTFWRGCTGGKGTARCSCFIVDAKFGGYFFSVSSSQRRLHNPTLCPLDRRVFPARAQRIPAHKCLIRYLAMQKPANNSRHGALVVICCGTRRQWAFAGLLLEAHTIDEVHSQIQRRNRMNGRDFDWHFSSAPGAFEGHSKSINGVFQNRDNKVNRE